jgi:hypothetical protein
MQMQMLVQMQILPNRSKPIETAENKKPQFQGEGNALGAQKMFPGERAKGDTAIAGLSGTRRDWWRVV